MTHISVPVYTCLHICTCMSMYRCMHVTVFITVNMTVSTCNVCHYACLCLYVHVSICAQTWTLAQKVQLLQPSHSYLLDTKCKSGYSTRCQFRRHFLHETRQARPQEYGSLSLESLSLFPATLTWACSVAAREADGQLLLSINRKGENARMFHLYCLPVGIWQQRWGSSSRWVRNYSDRIGALRPKKTWRQKVGTRDAWRMPRMLGCLAAVPPEMSMGSKLLIWLHFQQMRTEHLLNSVIKPGASL